MRVESLKANSRAALFEVARMAYGSREGEAGGKGHMGLYRPHGGGPRVIKFDTHGGQSNAKGAKASSNELRTLLMDLAHEANLPDDTCDLIRRKLGLSKSERPLKNVKLLDRKVAAEVAGMIGGRNFWNKVKKTYVRKDYKSADETGFDAVKRALLKNGDSANARRIPDLDADCIRNLRTTVLDELGEDVPEEDRDTVTDLMERTFPDDGEFTAALAKSNRSAAEVKNLMRRCMLRLLAVKGGDRIGNKTLSRFLDDRIKANKMNAVDVLSDVDLLKWCANKDRKDGLLVKFLQNMLMAELTGAGSSDDIREATLRYDGEDVPFSGSGNALKALRNVLSEREVQPTTDDIEELVDLIYDELGQGKFVKRDDYLKHLGSDPVEVKNKIRADIMTSRGLMPRRVDGGVLSAALKKNTLANARNDDRKNGRLPFSNPFIRVLVGKADLGIYTINGQPVKTGPAEIRSPLERDGRVVTLCGHNFNGIDKNAFAFLRQLEEKVPNADIRRFLTMLMSNVDDPLSVLAAQDPDAVGFGAENHVKLQQSGSHAGVSCGGTTRFDLSFEGDVAVLRERINLAPSRGSVSVDSGDGRTLFGCGDRGHIPEEENWYEVTTRVDMSQNVGPDGIPEFTQTVRPIAGDSSLKLFERGRTMRGPAALKQFARVAEEHQESGDYYVRLDKDREGLESAGSRNILRGSVAKAENNRVRETLEGAILAYYGAESIESADVPRSVSQEMTGFNGGGHPLSASRIGKIMNAVELDRINRLSRKELECEPNVARVRMRGGEHFKCKYGALNDLVRSHDLGWVRKDPEFFLKDAEKNIRPAVVPAVLRQLRKESGSDADNASWRRDLGQPRTTVAFGSRRGVSYGALADNPKAKDAPEKVVRAAENDIASFVSRGEVGDFRRLNSAQRKLALFVKANLNKDLGGLADKAAHRRDEYKRRFKVNYDSNAMTSDYSVDFTSDGGLVFKCRRKTPVTGYQVGNGGPGLRHTFLGTRPLCFEEVAVRYSKEDVEKILNADFGKLGTAAEKKAFPVSPKVTVDFAFDIGEEG